MIVPVFIDEQVRAAIMAELGSGEPEVLVCIDDGADCLLEGRVAGDTFAASLQREARGTITRCLLYRTPAIPPSPTWPGRDAVQDADARQVLDTYFEPLLAGFRRRGNRPYAHTIAVALQRGSECMIEGTATGTALGGSFVSSLSLDRDGRIRRYAAFYCEPPVPRR